MLQVARELVAKRQKERALLALKRRKLHEQQLERLVRRSSTISMASPYADLMQTLMRSRTFMRWELSGLVLMCGACLSAGRMAAQRGAGAQQHGGRKAADAAVCCSQSRQ